MKTISELAEVIGGYAIPLEERRENGNFLVIRYNNIKQDNLIFSKNDIFIDNLPENRKKTILQPGDVVVSLIPKEWKPFVYRKNYPPAIISNHFAIIRAKYFDYIQLYLSTQEGVDLLQDKIRENAKGTCIQRVNLFDLSQIEVPIIPLADLDRISLRELSRASKSEIFSLRKELIELREENKGLQQDNKLIVDKLDSNTKKFEKFAEKVFERFDQVESKLDKIIDILINIQHDIEIIKNGPRQEEEKIKLIYDKISKKLNSISASIKKDIEIYEEIAEDQIHNWSKLDPLSKKLLPMAEFLFDKLKELDDADYSPVILQYCKSLENELLRKIFAEYTIDFHTRNVDASNFLSIDLTNEKTSVFSKRILKTKGNHPDDVKYTLGEMKFIISLASGKSTVGKSPLLQDFNLFINKNFNKETFYSKEFVNSLEKIVNEFRNMCAHPYKLDEQEAQRCKEIVPTDIDGFLFMFKEKNG